MTANVVNQMAFLRTSREFPEDLIQLTKELTKSYLDTANAVNIRTIAMFPTLRPAVTGESFFLVDNRRQQSLRQVYTFSTINPGLPINIPYKITGLQQFSRIYGTCITAQPDYRPIPYASVGAANIDIRVVPTTSTTGNIVIVTGAASPVINSGLVVLEWLSNP